MLFRSLLALTLALTSVAFTGCSFLGSSYVKVIEDVSTGAVSPPRSARNYYLEAIQVAREKDIGEKPKFLIGVDEIYNDGGRFAVNVGEHGAGSFLPLKVSSMAFGTIRWLGLWSTNETSDSVLTLDRLHKIDNLQRAANGAVRTIGEGERKQVLNPSALAVQDIALPDFILTGRIKGPDFPTGEVAGFNIGGFGAKFRNYYGRIYVHLQLVHRISRCVAAMVEFEKDIYGIEGEFGGGRIFNFLYVEATMAAGQRELWSRSVHTAMQAGILDLIAGGLYGGTEFYAHMYGAFPADIKPPEVAAYQYFWPESPNYGQGECQRRSGTYAASVKNQSKEQAAALPQDIATILRDRPDHPVIFLPLGPDGIDRRDWMALGKLIDKNGGPYTAVELVGLLVPDEQKGVVERLAHALAVRTSRFAGAEEVQKQKMQDSGVVIALEKKKEM